MIAECAASPSDGSGRGDSLDGCFDGLRFGTQRGVKRGRYAHEIVAWNSYSVGQRDEVWRRLQALRDGCVEMHLEVTDETRLRQMCETLQVEVGTSLLTLAYEALRRAGAEHGLDALGLRPLDAQMSVRSTLRDAIDTEFYLRSVAHYERNFRASFSV